MMPHQTFSPLNFMHPMHPMHHMQHMQHMQSAVSPRTFDPSMTHEDEFGPQSHRSHLSTTPYLTPSPPSPLMLDGPFQLDADGLSPMPIASPSISPAHGHTHAWSPVPPAYHTPTHMNRGYAATLQLPLDQAFINTNANSWRSHNQLRRNTTPTSARHRQELAPSNNRIQMHRRVGLWDSVSPSGSPPLQEPHQTQSQSRGGRRHSTSSASATALTARKRSGPHQTDPDLLEMDEFMVQHRVSEPSPSDPENEFDFVLLRGVANARNGMRKADPKSIQCKYGRRCFRKDCRFAHDEMLFGADRYNPILSQDQQQLAVPRR